MRYFVGSRENYLAHDMFCCLKKNVRISTTFNNQINLNLKTYLNKKKNQLQYTHTCTNNLRKTTGNGGGALSETK